MALVVELANKAASSWTDITDKVKVYDGMRVGHNAYLGEVGTGSGFDLDDDAGALTIPVKRVVRIRETATSPDTILFRGRVAEKNVSRGEMPLEDSRSFDVQLDDVNADLRGIPVRKWGRPRETDYQRVIALWKRFLKGSPRASTRLVVTRDGDPRWVRNANRVTLPKQTYTDTDPAGVLLDIAEAAAKEYFVTNRREIFYDLPTSTKFAAGLSITDVSPNGSTSFPPNHPVTGAQDGSEFLSGVVVTYGKDKRMARYRPAVEDDHDYWREVVPIDSTSADDARQRAKATLAGQAREDVTITVSIDLLASQVGLVRAGQTLSFRSAAAGLLSPIVLRVGRLLWEPLAPGRYRAHMELGFPKKLVPRIRRGLGKNPGNRTARSGPSVQAGSPECPDMPVIVASQGAADGDFFGGDGGYEVDVEIPDGCDVAGRLLIGCVAWTNQASNDVDALMVAEGFSHLLVTNQVSDTRALNFYQKEIVGDEGWTGTGDVITLTLSGPGSVVAAFRLLTDWYDDSGPAWGVNPGNTADPDAIADTGWPAGTPVLYIAGLMSDVYGGITGAPDGYTGETSGSVDASSDTHDIHLVTHSKNSTAQNEDPSTYACASPLLSFTIAIRGLECTSTGFVTGEAGQVFGSVPVEVVAP